MAIKTTTTPKKSRVFFGLGISSKGAIYTKKFQGSAARREWVAKANGRFDADAFAAAYGFAYPAGSQNRFALDYRTAARATDAKKLSQAAANRELASILCKVSGVNATPAAAPAPEKTAAPAVQETPAPVEMPAPVVQETPAPAVPETVEFSLEELAAVPMREEAPAAPVVEEIAAPVPSISAAEMFTRFTSSFNFFPFNAKKRGLWKPEGKLMVRNAVVAALDGDARRFAQELNAFAGKKGLEILYRYTVEGRPAWISITYERENARRGQSVYTASVYFDADDSKQMQDFIACMNAALSVAPARCKDYDAPVSDELPF